VLPAAGRAGRAAVEIQDRNGAVIHQETVTLGAGATRWQWDGKDSRGTQRPDGSYRVVVNGRAEDGSAVPIASNVTGRVTGAARIEGDLMLRMGGTTIGFDRLREVPGS
jgi:flagellar basal-body rod modification protein FlgD